MRPETRLLLRAATNAATAANAVKPLSRRGGSSILGFGSGMMATEAPLPLLAAQVLSTWRFVRRKDLRLDSPQVIAALGLNVASWAGLVAMHVRATRTPRLLDQALAEGLGDVPAMPNRPPVGLRETFAPVPTARNRYCTDPDIAYGPAGRRNRLDVWRSRTTAPAPVLLQIHGGAWCTGEKEQQGIPLMAEMVERGWVCVAPNYRLSPRATWPDHIVDIKRALAWVREHIHEYGGDPRFVAVTGGSAGGHLSSLTALSQNDPAFQPGFEDADTSIQAAVPIYGVYDFLDRDRASRSDLKDFLARLVMKTTPSEDPEGWDAASPMARVTSDAPPFMIVHGTNDSLVPVEQARVFAQRMRQTSAAPVVWVELPGAQHAFEILPSVRATHTVRAIGGFLDRVYGDWVAAHGGDRATAAVGR